GRIPRQVMDVMGISRRVVKFLRRFGFPEPRLRFIERAGPPCGLPGSHGRCSPKVFQVLSIGFMGHEVADIAVSFIPDGPPHVHPRIHSSAKTERVFPWGGGLSAQKRLTLHTGRYRYAC